METATIRCRVTAVWWPDGWEPCGELDVATVRGLNRQNMAHPGQTWYVLCEADEPAAAAGPVGIEALLAGAAEPPLRVIFPAGSGPGDCSHCPAQGHTCATV